MFEEEYFKDRNPELEPKHEYEVKKWIQYFSLEPKDKVFVHGCGYGQRLHYFREMGMDAHGMDVSEYARKHAYEKAVGRITDYITQIKQDLVISVDVLEHLNDWVLTDSLIKLSSISNRAVYGITYKTSHNYIKDPTHINGKTKQEWKDYLLQYYDKIYNAPIHWVESDMYLIWIIQ